MTEQSTVGRDVAWYEARHVQLARRIGNYRRNIKQLQRAYAFAFEAEEKMGARWRAERENTRRLEGELAHAKRHPQLEWVHALRLAVWDIAGAVFALTVSLTALAAIVILARWLWHIA